MRHPARHNGGAINSNAATAKMAPDKGRVTKVLQSPMLMVSACRMDCSAMGAKIKPTIKGAAGKSKRRMA